MSARYTELAREVLDKSLEVREEAGLALGVPLNVFDLCEKLEPKVRVRFADYSMEGCYSRSDRPLIEVSSLRPIGRRVFNTAHELGHHVLGHPGMRLDDQLEEGDSKISDPDEYAANTFAGYLLMPKIAVRRAFRTRNWAIDNPQPEQVFTVACHFGVGYRTLISHMEYALRVLEETQANKLRKIQLPAIRRTLLGSNTDETLWVVDRQYEMPTLDSEVGMILLLPKGCRSEFNNLKRIADLTAGTLFRSERSGLTRVVTNDGWAITVRISRFQYSGWSTNRHLEPEDDDE